MVIRRLPNYSGIWLPIIGLERETGATGRSGEEVGSGTRPDAERKTASANEKEKWRLQMFGQVMRSDPMAMLTVPANGNIRVINRPVALGPGWSDRQQSEILDSAISLPRKSGPVRQRGLPRLPRTGPEFSGLRLRSSVVTSTSHMPGMLPVASPAPAGELVRGCPRKGDGGAHAVASEVDTEAKGGSANPKMVGETAAPRLSSSCEINMK